jgi:protein-disulfide isomerase
VTVVEFVDFQCPFCKRGFDFQSKIMKDYAGKVRWVYKAFPLPFHPWAEMAAEAAECAKERDESKFWGFHDDIFQHQDVISGSKDPSANLLALAKESGYSSKKFLSCYDSKVTSGTIHKDIDEGQSVGINGTPGYMVNGHLVVGADEQTLRTRIDECLQGKHGKYSN